MKENSFHKKKTIKAIFHHGDFTGATIKSHVAAPVKPRPRRFGSVNCAHITCRDRYRD